MSIEAFTQYWQAPIIYRKRLYRYNLYGDSDWEEQLYILRKSWCPAVLTENFFMDSKSDLEYLQSRAGKQAVVDTHLEGIIEYLESR